MFLINYFRKKITPSVRANTIHARSVPTLPPVGAHTPSRRTSPGIVHCWEKLLAAWEPASAMEAGQLLAAGTLFKDAREAGLEEGRIYGHETQRADGATVYGHTTPTRPTPSYLRDDHNDNKQTQLTRRPPRAPPIPQTCHVSRTHPRGPAQATHIPGLKPQTESYVHISRSCREHSAIAG